MRGFEVKRLIDNIYSTAKKNGMKIGDLEAKAGVSQGYFSRLRGRETGAPAPSIEVIASAAETLGTTVDSLLYDAGSPNSTPNEKRIMALLDKLIVQTRTYAIDWVRETKQYLDNIEIDCGKACHPLFGVRKRETPYSTAAHPDFDYYTEYESDFVRRNSAPVSIGGDGFRCQITSFSIVYLEKVSLCVCENEEIDEKTQYELYLFTAGKASPLCRSNNDDSRLDRNLEMLYNAAAEATSHIQIDERALAAIDEYLYGTKDGALPF